MKKSSRILLGFFAIVVTPLLALRQQLTMWENDKEQQQKHNKEIDFIDFHFVDIMGNLKEITLPGDRIKSAIEDGLFFDGSSVLGYKAVNQSDLLAKPDITSVFLNPFIVHDLQGVAVFCDIYDSNGQPYVHDPRSVLKKAVARAEQAGYACNCGVELEFFLFKQDGTPCDDLGYCDAMNDLALKSFKQAMMYSLHQSGIELEKTHKEVAPGQHEIVLKYNNPVFIADSLTYVKHVLTTAAHANGYVITFMPKPYSKQNGSGMHIHMSLSDKVTGHNAFYDPEKKYALSDTARSFLAGILTHLMDVTLLLNGSVNSFKRLVEHCEAPLHICWGAENRSSVARIPKTNADSLIATQGQAVRIEFRSPDASCNPYLALTALIEAGLDGIEQGYELPREVEENVYRLTSEQLHMRGIARLPYSLRQSINYFEKSEFAKKILGESLHNQLVHLKNKEWNDYILHATDDTFIISDWEKKQFRLIP